MAGAGYKLFNTGDVLTAAQVNTYLQEQTVMVFANSTARTTALSGVLAEGMMSYLQDTNAVEVYNGTSWVNVGNAGDITEVQAGVGISIASGTGPIPVITNSSTDLITTAGDILYGTAADTMARLGIGTAGQVLKVNSGATAPEWGAAGGPTFTTYTPSWTNLTVGNGTVTAASATNGDLVSVVVKLVFGSTTSVSGLIKYSLPSTAHSTVYLSQFPGGLMLDSGSYYIECQTQIYDSGTNGAIVWNNINEGATAQNFPVQSNTSSTLPWTWATNDQIVSAFTYRKA